VSESLRKVSEGFASWTGLFSVKTKMVGIAQHLLKHEPGLIQTGRINPPRPGQCLYQPERTDVEGPLFSWQAIRGLFYIVSMD
jgi:hypothetical protein